MPVCSTLLDQAHNAIERKLFAMKGFQHPGGSQQAFLTGLAHLVQPGAPVACPLRPYEQHLRYGKLATTSFFFP
jgi:hypothetical protein